MEEAATAEFDSLIKNSELVLSNVDTDLLTLKDYLEKWRIQIWEHGFFNFFKGKIPFIKSSVFAEHPGTSQAVQRLLYRFVFYFNLSSLAILLHALHLDSYLNLCVWMIRYITREMVMAKAIEKRDVPMFLSGWIDKSSENCMFDGLLLKMWKLNHLKSGAWYLECPCSACPAEEAALFAHNDALPLDDLLFEGLGESEEELEITAAPAAGSHADVAVALTPHLSGSTSRSSRRLIKRSQQTASKERAELEALPVDGSTKGKGVNQSSPFATVPFSQSTASNFSSQFGAFQPPHLRAFSALAGVKSASDMLVLIINDSLSSMLQVQESSGAFPTSFQDITSFLTKVVFEISCLS